MGTLQNMLSFLTENKKYLEDIIKTLESKQLVFNENLLRIREIRKNELLFLLNAYKKDAASFPEKIKKRYAVMHEKQKKFFEKNLTNLEKEKKNYIKNFSDKDRTRLNFIRDIKNKNLSLENKEEKLKKKVIELQNQINSYNEKIDEMNTGFGFISNFFKMRKTAKEKQELLDKQDDMVDRVELLRKKWTEAEEEYSENTSQLQENWNNSLIDYATIDEKIEYLKKWEHEIVEKGAMSETLKEIQGHEKYPEHEQKTARVKKCPHCNSANKDNLYYCRICGRHFTADSKDIYASLTEYGELNTVYEDCTEGITLCVSTIALMRGLKKGMETFISSVSDVKASQDSYASLPKLQIDVPEKSRTLSYVLSSLNQKVKDKKKTAHPLVFHKEVSPAVALITEKEIELFFKAMGDELNKRTKEQW